MLGLLNRLYYGAFFIADVVVRRMLPVAGLPFAALLVMKSLLVYQNTGELDLGWMVIAVPASTVLFLVVLSVLCYLLVIIEDKNLRQLYFAARTKQDFDDVHRLVRPKF